MHVYLYANMCKTGVARRIAVRSRGEAGAGLSAGEVCLYIYLHMFLCVNIYMYMYMYSCVGKRYAYTR